MTKWPTAYDDIYHTPNPESRTCEIARANFLIEHYRLCLTRNPVLKLELLDKVASLLAELEIPEIPLAKGT